MSWVSIIEVCLYVLGVNHCPGCQSLRFACMSSCRRSMKHHLTETHEHNFEIHNNALSLQSVSLRLCVKVDWYTIPLQLGF